MIFNQDTVGWQYGVASIDLSDANSSTNKTPSKITIYPRYDYQANMAIFDNLSVIKENVTIYSYDENGNVKGIRDNGSQNSLPVYDNYDLTSVTDAKGNKTTYDYTNHSLKKVISQNKVTTDIANNGYGNPTQSVTRNESSSMKILTNTTYTADGAFIDSMYDQDNYVTSYSYNQDKGLLSSVTNAKGNTVSYGYNANTDQLTSVTGSVGGNTVTNSYEYNKNTLTKINHNGFSYNFLYDNYGNNSGVKVGNQLLASYQYGTNNGSLNEISYANGNKKSYTYDIYGNITQVEIDGSKKYLWNADSQGNIIKQEDLINKLLYNYEFDLNGKLIRQSVEDTSKAIGTGRNAYLLEYGYDLNNNVDRFVNKAGSRTLTHTYSYGLDDLLSSYTMPTGKTVTYNYDTLNRLNQYQIGTTTPVTVAYQYASSKRNAEGQSTYRTTKIY